MCSAGVASASRTSTATTTAGHGRAWMSSDQRAQRGLSAAAAAADAALAPGQRQAQPVDPVPGLAEDGGQHGERAEHRQEHRERRRDRRAVQERQPEQQQAEQRDDHGAAGEEDGPPGGVHRHEQRGVALDPAPDLRSIARDDDQRVVDPDRQADERGELARELGRVDDVRDDRHEPERRAKREHRGEQRHARRDRRAEEEQQDERRGDDADELGAAALLGEADDLRAEAAVLDAQVRPARAERLLLDALEVRRLEGLELVLVRDRRDADAPVRA